jgi:hypothetical protein
MARARSLPSWVCGDRRGLPPRRPGPAETRSTSRPRVVRSVRGRPSGSRGRAAAVRAKQNGTRAEPCNVFDRPAVRKILNAAALVASAGCLPPRARWRAVRRRTRRLTVGPEPQRIAREMLRERSRSFLRERHVAGGRRGLRRDGHPCSASSSHRATDAHRTPAWSPPHSRRRDFSTRTA